MLFDTPDWAARHNYFHHSNPRRPRAKQIYEKTHVRPKINAAWKTLKNPDANKNDKDYARGVIARLSDNRSNAAMEAGTAVQLATDLHLVPDEFDQTLSLPEAIETATRSLRQYTPQDYSDTVRENDTARQEKYLEELPDVIENAVVGLREAMHLENRILGEIDLIDTLPGNALPHFTKPDYARCGDLKTKWSRLSSRAKSGWQSASLPRTLTGMFDMNNVYQVAGFGLSMGIDRPWLLYCSSSDYRLFDQNNTPELRDDYLHDVVADMALQHKTTENILRAAETKEELLGLVAPDWTAIHWNEPPTYLDEAKKNVGGAAMTASTAIADLIAAQGACDPVLKDATNPHFRSKYASLSSCVDACKEAFHRHNFALLQSNGHDEYGQYVKTELLHTTGASWGSVVYLVLSKQDMQGLGSAITYARRYGLLGMVGLAPEDDDGNASIPPTKPAPAPKPEQAKPAPKPAQTHNSAPIMDLDQWQVWVVDQKRKIDYCSEKYHLSKWAKDTKKLREELAEFDRETMAALKDHYAMKHEELNSGVRR